MYKSLTENQKKIAVIGLGYVGLPLALALARTFEVIAFDTSYDRIRSLTRSSDPMKEMEPADFENKKITFTDSIEDLREASFFIIAVPTPVDVSKSPDLYPLRKASEIIGSILKKGDYVVYESTVYPGCTEEDSLPLLELYSGMKAGPDFKVGYSPERINPGDKTGRFADITKVVAGIDTVTTDTLAKVYGKVFNIYKAPSIRVAEAARLLENVQRDVNIALVNELSEVFKMLDIDTCEVIETAATKWNFQEFRPGLPGGNNMGLGAYYLLHTSREKGFEPSLLNSTRKVNEEMPQYAGRQIVRELSKQKKAFGDMKILVMGITYKENVTDIRNSQQARLIKELAGYSLKIHVVDPYASAEEVKKEYGLTLRKNIEDNYDAVVLAVSHDIYKKFNVEYFKSITSENAVFFDLNGSFPSVKTAMNYWRL